MANKLFYTYIHGEDCNGESNNSFIPQSYAFSYWDSLIFDVNHRTIWHNGMPFGNVYPGTLSYGEVFNDIDHNIAKGAYSHAEGFNNAAYGNYSHIEGEGNSAYSTHSHIEGYKNKIYDDANYSHAEGRNNNIKKIGGHVEGINSNVFGEYAHAEGNTTTASGDYSHAEGNTTIAFGLNTHAEGNDNHAIGNNSHVEGSSNTTQGISAHAEGNLTNANANYSHTEGNNITIDPVSTCSHAEGNSNNIYISENSHVEGSSNNINSGNNSHVEGLENTIINGNCIHVEGGKNKNIQGNYIHVEGYNNYVNNNNINYAHIEGSNNIVDGNSAHAEGDHTKALGINSHSEGNTTTASGLNSHAEGNNTQSIGENSHVEGINTIANGNNSHAGGNSTIVNSLNGFAHGLGLVTSNDNETSFGKYNKSYTDGVKTNYNTIFSIGNGENQQNTSNVFDIRKSGTAYFYTYAYSWDEVDENIRIKNSGSFELFEPKLDKLATVSYVRRNTAGRVNFLPLENFAPKYNGAEYFNTSISNMNMAYANYSHAEGFNTSTYGDYSHTEGEGTITYNTAEHASGKFNYSHKNANNDGNTLFSVGCGIDENNRKNIFELRENYNKPGRGFIDDNPIVTSIGGETTYIWTGIYNDYIKDDLKKSTNTLYFIDDDGAISRNDIITKSELKDFESKLLNNVKTLLSSAGILWNANYKVENGIKVFEGTQNGGSVSSGPIKYVWSGTKEQYDRMSSEMKEYDDVVFIITNKS